MNLIDRISKEADVLLGKRKGDVISIRYDILGLILIPFVIFYEEPSAWYDLGDHLLGLVLFLFPLLCFLTMGTALAIIMAYTATVRPVFEPKEPHDDGDRLISIACLGTWAAMLFTFGKYPGLVLLILSGVFMVATHIKSKALIAKTANTGTPNTIDNDSST